MVIQKVLFKIRNWISYIASSFLYIAFLFLGTLTSQSIFACTANVDTSTCAGWFSDNWSFPASEIANGREYHYSAPNTVYTVVGSGLSEWTDGEQIILVQCNAPGSTTCRCQADVRGEQHWPIGFYAIAQCNLGEEMTVRTFYPEYGTFYITSKKVYGYCDKMDTNNIYKTTLTTSSSSKETVSSEQDETLSVELTTATGDICVCRAACRGSEGDEYCIGNMDAGDKFQCKPGNDILMQSGAGSTCTWKVYTDKESSGTAGMPSWVPWAIGGGAATATVVIGGGICSLVYIKSKAQGRPGTKPNGVELE